MMLFVQMFYVNIFIHNLFHIIIQQQKKNNVYFNHFLEYVKYFHIHFPSILKSIFNKPDDWL